MRKPFMHRKYTARPLSVLPPLQTLRDHNCTRERIGYRYRLASQPLGAGFQPGTVSFRRTAIAAWRHAAMAFTGFGQPLYGSHRKTVVCRKLCPAKGRSGAAGTSVSTDRPAADGRPGSGQPFSGSRNGTTGAHSPKDARSECQIEDGRVRRTVSGSCSGNGAETAHEGGVSPRASPSRRLPEPSRSRVHGP